MYLEFLTPEVFDAFIIINIVIGLLIAARRFRKDINSPLPDDAPQPARERFEACGTSASPDRS